MGGTGFFLPRAAALHDPGWGHRDHQGRLRALTSALGAHMPVLAGRVRQREGAEAASDDLLRVHDEAYLQRLREASGRAEEAGAPEDWGGEVRVSGGSWQAAAATSGAAVEAALAVARGELRNAFVAGRPPGHGASASAPGGFSLLNHVAVAVRALQAAGLVERVLVVDWGVHGGGGTEAVLRRDPSVALFSLEEGDAARREGEGEAKGVRVREVVREGEAREEYLRRFREGLAEAARRARPDFVLLSAGLDVLESDPLGSQALQPADIHGMTVRVMDETRGTAGDRLVGVLEGGYDPGPSGEGVAQILRALAGLPPAAP